MWVEVEAVLFDIDGTLVDSTAAVERTWATWAEKYRIGARREYVAANRRAVSSASARICSIPRRQPQ